VLGVAAWRVRGARRVPALFVVAPRAIRCHWLFAVLLVAGLAFRILTQVTYRPALVYIDSDKYLRGFYGQDPLGYRALLWPLQRVGGLGVVAAAQHILGLAIAFALYGVLRRCGTWRWAAAVASAPVLLDGYQLQAEQTIMPDVMFQALIVAGLALLLWHREPTAWLLGAAGLMFGAATMIRQVGEVLVVPAVVFGLVCAARWRRGVLHGAVITTSFALPVLACMTAHAAANGHFAITQRNSYITFYGRVAVAADCATLRLPPDERALCPSPQVAALGIDLIYPLGPLRKYRPPPGMTTEEMVERFELAVLRQQPLAVVKSIDHDFVKLFALTRDQSPGDTPISRWQFQTAYPTYPPLITLRYVAEVRPGGGTPTIARPLAAALRGYQLHGGYTPGPLLAIAAIAGLAGACGVVAPGRARPALASACVLAAGTALAVVIAADAFEFSWRYQLPALALLPPAGVLGIAALAAQFRFVKARHNGIDLPGHAGRSLIRTPITRHSATLPDAVVFQIQTSSTGETGAGIALDAERDERVHLLSPSTPTVPTGYAAAHDAAD